MTKRKTTRKAKPIRKPRKRTVSVQIDDEAFAAAEAILVARGTTIKNWITLSINAFSKTSKPVVGLEDKMPFGKYYGSKVEDVIRGDPSYSKWLLTTAEVRDRFADPVHDLFRELAQ